MYAEKVGQHMVLHVYMPTLTQYILYGIKKYYQLNRHYDIDW